MKQEHIDKLYEAIVEMAIYQEPETIVEEFYDKDPETIEKKTNVKSKEEFLRYIKKANSMSMKMAEYATENIISSIFKVARKMQPKEIERIIRNYYDSEFKLS